MMRYCGRPSTAKARNVAVCQLALLLPEKWIRPVKNTMEKSMTAYVAEINGRAIAAFNAENDIQAEGRASSKPFRGALTVLENEGQPLWNDEDEILVRKALPAEEAQFDASRARAIKDKEIDVDDDWLMFLVPVTDPTGDFDPYDAPGG